MAEQDRASLESLLVALHPSTVAVRIGGESFLIEDASAADWIEALVDGTVADLFSVEEQRRFDDLFDAGAIDVEEMQRSFYDAVEVASGRPWYVAARLIGCLTNPQARGEIFSGVDVNTASLAAVCDVIYAVHVRWVTNEKKRKEFDDQLNAPVSVTPQVTDMREYARQMRERSAAASAAASGTPSET